MRFEIWRVCVSQYCNPPPELARNAVARERAPGQGSHTPPPQSGDKLKIASREPRANFRNSVRMPNEAKIHNSARQGSHEQSKVVPTVHRNYGDCQSNITSVANTRGKGLINKSRVVPSMHKVNSKRGHLRAKLHKVVNQSS